LDKIIKKKKFTLSRILSAILVLSFTIFLAYTIFFRDNSSKLNVDTEKILIEKVKKDYFLDYMSTSGTVMPIRTVFLDALEGGRVEEIFLEDGAMVKKGDIILRLSNTNLQMEIMNREANLADNINNLRNTRINMEQKRLNLKSQMLEIDYQIVKEKRKFDIDKQLFNNKQLSKEKFIETENRFNYLIKKRKLTLENQKQDSIFRITQVKQLEESVNRMQQNFEIMREKLDDLNVKAPLDGQLSSVNAEIGQAIRTSQRLGKIDILTSYKIRTLIDEYYISKINNGLVGEFEFNNETYRLKIKKIFLEVQNGKFNVDLVFIDKNNIPKNIRLGQSFRIKLELGEPKESIQIPRGGFFQSTGGNWIFVVDKSGKFATKRDIIINRQNPKFFEITEGLEVGEEVIISGYENFGDVEKLILKK